MLIKEALDRFKNLEEFLIFMFFLLGIRINQRVVAKIKEFYRKDTAGGIVIREKAEFVCFPIALP